MKYNNLTTTYFSSYEERETAFRKTVSNLIPRKHLGPAIFWKDFTSLSIDRAISPIGCKKGFITSNPRDCLVFGIPRQVLTAAGLQALSTVPRKPVLVEEVLQRFGLLDQADQPVRTLSGGETVKLAIAKTYIEEALNNHLTIASPFSWLSSSNQTLFDFLFTIYCQKGIPVELMALQGENDSTPFDPAVFWGDTQKIASFSISLREVRIVLKTSINPLTPEQSIAEVDNFESELLSPCLLIGENGEGKSLIAKVLANAVPHHGYAALERLGHTGKARLLFQDIITQTLLRSFTALSFSYGKNVVISPQDLFVGIQSRLSQATPVLASSERIPVDDFQPSAPGILDIKSILVATRLAALPAALILDEPDWGLTKSDTLKFVSAILSISHSLGIPVMIISHKNWWKEIAASIVVIEKSCPATPKRGFGLHLNRIK